MEHIHFISIGLGVVRGLFLLGGLVFAVSRWNQHPMASMLAASGCGLHLVGTLMSTALNALGVFGDANVALAVSLPGVTGTVATLLILSGVFADRIPARGSP